MRFKLNFKKVIISLVFLAAIITVFYFYAYQSHRDIATENAAFTMDSSEIIAAFSEDFKKATQKYANQTILINGTISNIDLDEKIIMLNESISVLGIEKIELLKSKQKLTIKGRLVGYDELLGEIVIDQSVIINSDAK